jgi:DNA-binding MarR family transcriptional regulator
MTVNRAVARIGVPLRPSGIASHPQMVAIVDHRLSRQVRAAVEGRLHGWKRLRRFQIAMAFPSLDQATAYLGLPKSGLVAQLQRLEADVGAQLFIRSRPKKPQALTPAGKNLLDALNRPHARGRMAEALGTNLEAMPDEAAIDAAVTHFHRPYEKPGPLKPFDDNEVTRLRMTTPTLRILQDITAHGHPRVCGQQVATRTQLGHGTVYPALQRLHSAGWLTSWVEDDQEWLARSSEGRGPGRRRVFYAFTPEGRRAAVREIADRSAQPKRQSR